MAVPSPQGRFAAAAAVLDGRVLRHAEAHGKHLFHTYGTDLVVRVRPPDGQVRMPAGRPGPLERSARACGLWVAQRS